MIVHHHCNRTFSNGCLGQVCKTGQQISFAGGVPLCSLPLFHPFAWSSLFCLRLFWFLFLLFTASHIQKHRACHQNHSRFFPLIFIFSTFFLPVKKATLRLHCFSRYSSCSAERYARKITLILEYFLRTSARRISSAAM